jgi:hypothetical protein
MIGGFGRHSARTQEEVQNTVMHAFAALVLLAQTAVALPPDSVDRLRSRARSAEANYERLARRLAPFTWSAPSASECDEIVGRFCLRFGSGYTPPPAGEAGRVIDARRDAVEAARRFFSAAPHDRRAAGPLVRLLIADGRESEAVSTAGAFAVLSTDSLWSDLLLGLAHHAAGSERNAARHFTDALARMQPGARGAWLDPGWLLDPAERSRVRRLGPADRAQYDRRFWLLADPFWLTPPNEVFNAHAARQVAAGLLADVPLVGTMVKWGADLDELTVRYGTPTSRRQTPGSPTTGPGQVEYWDSAQRAFAPERVSGGLRGPPMPGESSDMYAERARSSYGFASVGRVVELPHQVSRFLRGDSVLIRVDGVFSAEAVGAARAGLFVYDSALSVASVHRMGMAELDSGRVALFATAAPGPLIYSAEVLVDADTIVVGARARYALDAFMPAAGPIVSDVLLARRLGTAQPRDVRDPALHGVADLTVAAGDTIGIYAEVYRAAGATIRAELRLEPAGGASLLRQLGSWIGRTVGVVRPARNPRVGWDAPLSDGVHVIALDLPLDARRRGMHELVLRVDDGVATTETRRRFLIR